MATPWKTVVRHSSLNEGKLCDQGAGCALTLSAVFMFAIHKPDSFQNLLQG